MTLPINRTAKAALDANLVNGITSDAPKVKASNDIIYNTIDELNSKADLHAGSSTLAHPDGSVTRPKIANKAIGSPQLDDLAVGQTHHQDNGIPSRALPDNLIVQRHMSDNSVGSAELQSGSVQSRHVADGVLTSSKFVPGTLNNDTENGLRITALQADIANKHITVNSKNLADETSRLQTIVDALTDGDVLELRGTFNVTYLAFLTKKNIRICGNATINYLVNTLSACFDMYDIEDSVIEGITFIGLKDKTGAPTIYTDNQNYLIKLGQAKNVHITNCKFKKHLGRSIQVNSVKGNWVDQGVSIYKNWFEEMADVNSNEQCCIYMDSNAQYSTIENNTFISVKSAIHNFGANNRLNYNNVTDCALNAVGTVVDYNDLINLKQAHILVAQKTPTDNQSKVQIIGNKINHMIGNVPAIMCVGNIGMNENYFVVKDNEALVNNAPHEIIISSSSGARIVGNSLGRNGGTENVSRLVLHQSELAIIDENFFIGDVVAAIIAGSTFYEGKNTRRFQVTAKTYTYVVVSGYPNKRFTTENIGFAFIANGTVADWLSNLVGVSTTKTGAGAYTVNHGLGHQQYVIQAITESNNGIIQINSRVNNSFNVVVVDASGSPLDTTVIGDVKIVNGGYHNAEVCGW